MGGTVSMEGRCSTPDSLNKATVHMVHAQPPKVLPKEERHSYDNMIGAYPPKFQDVFVRPILAFQPVNKGDSFEIFIPEDFYQEQLRKFNFSLIARLLLNKGAAPLPISGAKKVD